MHDTHAQQIVEKLEFINGQLGELTKALGRIAAALEKKA